MGLKTILLLGITMIILIFTAVNLSNFLNKNLYGAENSTPSITTNEPNKVVVLKVGQPITSSNIKIVVEKILRTQKIKGNMGYRKIKDNETFIVVKVKIENLRKNVSYYISNMDFFLLDDKGRKYDCEMNVLDLKHALTITTIPPQESIEGYIIYKIPKDVKVVKICYTFRNIQNIFDSCMAIWEANVSDIPYVDEVSP
ncbi:MAG: DUF4352 domain-containing protein [Methanococci archaeon]|nr:DUF4352 domain-containing protein [Methanococci archaeon]